MVRPSRYKLSDEEVGLGGGVLRNKLGITDKTELEDTETVLLADAYEHFFDLLEKDSLQFNAQLLLEVHRVFLETLYEWAGELRTIDISKDGAMFAAAQFLQSSFVALDDGIANNLPESSDDKIAIAQKCAVIHNEFNAVHPFREGNGRAIRLFLDLLVATAGYGPINYGRSTDTYIAACIAGMKGDNEPMWKLIASGLTKN